MKGLPVRVRASALKKLPTSVVGRPLGRPRGDSWMVSSKALTREALW
jgi:hypothetical protein